MNQRAARPTQLQPTRSARAARAVLPDLASSNALIGPSSIGTVSVSSILRLQRAYGNRAVQRWTQQSIQRKPVKEGELDPSVGDAITRSRGGGSPLPIGLRGSMEQSFGSDFGGVRVHTDAQSDQLNRSVQAKAFTLGSDIYFRKGNYQPGSSSGQELLAHELTHVVQQGGSRASGMQTKLTLGPVGDRYEQEADRVAKQIVRGGNRPVVQRAQRVSIARVQLKAQPGIVRRTYAERAEAFERSLGEYAFTHPKANAAAKTMSDKVRQFIERKATEDVLGEKKIDELWQKAGTDREGIAGAVGMEVANIKKVFDKGNLRERLTHVHNFMTHHFGGATAENRGDLDRIVENPKALNKAFANQAGQSETGEAYFDDVLHKSQPNLTVLSQQRETRTPSGQDTQSKKTIGDVGFTSEGGMLSKREARHMHGNDNKQNFKGKALKWSEGARAWKMNKQHWWVKTMDGLDLPLMAGPSAHTNAFLNIARFLGMSDLLPVRLACIAQLIPIRAHSLVEILAAAEGHGLKFVAGPEMYRSLPPLTAKELRQVVGKGQYPDEIAGEATGLGGDYHSLLSKYKAYHKFIAKTDGEPEPSQQVKKLEELDLSAEKYIAKKQKEKDKLKNNPAEAKRLEGRITGVTDLRKELKPKLAEAHKALGRKRVQELQESGKYKKGVFHGTHTGLLGGLHKSNAQLMSGSELEKQGIVRSSGEGDFFSVGEKKGPKEFISVGEGEFGLGTALAYAEAAGKLRNYNIEKYTDAELALEVTQLDEAIKNFDETVVTIEKHQRDYKSKAQLENLYERLKSEQDKRKDLDPDHPRRKGQLSEGSNYPLLFEIDAKGLDMRDDKDTLASEELASKEGITAPLYGERMVYETIDLKFRLKRVYCPANKIGEVRAKLTTLLGHSKFEVLAIEALEELPPQGIIGGTQLDTYGTLEEFETVRQEVVAGYAEAMLKKTPITLSNLRGLAQTYGSPPPVPDKSTKPKLQPKPNKSKPKLPDKSKKPPLKPKPDLKKINANRPLPQPIDQLVPPVVKKVENEAPPQPEPDTSIDFKPPEHTGKGKPHVVLSGHGLLKEDTQPPKTSVPGNMSISFVGPIGSVLSNPLSNAIEEGRFDPNDIVVEAVSLESGKTTEITGKEIAKAYKTFGPRTIKGGGQAPNYTLTKPSRLAVSNDAHVLTVKTNTTLKDLFPRLQELYPKGVNVRWAACQDLPGNPLDFQIRVIHKSEKYQPVEGMKPRAQTEGKARKEEIKHLIKLIKEYQN